MQYRRCSRTHGRYVHITVDCKVTTGDIKGLQKEVKFPYLMKTERIITRMVI